MKVTGNLIKSNGYYHTRIFTPFGTKQKTTKIPVFGKNQRETNANRKAAEKILIERIVEWESKSTIDSNRLFLDCVADTVERDKAMHKVQLNTWEAYDSYLRNHIRPYFSQKKFSKLSISEITPLHIQGFVDNLYRTGYAVDSIRKYLVPINKTFQMALRYNWISYNPLDRIEFPGGRNDRPKSKGRAYTVEEAKRLLEAAEGKPIKQAIMIALYLGLRRSEIAGLRWKDIDFGRNVILISNTQVRQNTLLEHERTKNKASHDYIAIPEGLRRYLLELREKQKEMEALMGNCYVKDDHVCRREDGRHMTCDYISYAFRKLRDENHLPYIRLHDLRHTAGSWVYQETKDMKLTQRFLRHGDMATTARTYTHLQDDAVQTAANAIDFMMQK